MSEFGLACLAKFDLGFKVHDGLFACFQIHDRNRLAKAKMKQAEKGDCGNRVMIEFHALSMTKLRPLAKRKVARFWLAD